MINWWKEKVWSNKKYRRKIKSAGDATVLTILTFGLYFGGKYVLNALGY